jgi:putative heme-binding domain-containing protein
VRDWKVEELASSLDELNQGRSFSNGQKVFEAASCKACHPVRGHGANLGPDLNEMSQKIRDGKMNRLALLTELVQPSKTIDEKYRTQIISTLQGKLVSGVVVHEDDKVVRLLSNPLDEGEKSKEVAKAEIDERVESKTSLMPLGLLNALTKEDILDLLAYLESGGDPAYRAFSP